MLMSNYVEIVHAKTKLYYMWFFLLPISKCYMFVYVKLDIFKYFFRPQINVQHNGSKLCDLKECIYFKTYCNLHLGST